MPHRIRNVPDIKYLQKSHNAISNAAKQTNAMNNFLSRCHFFPFHCKSPLFRIDTHCFVQSNFIPMIAETAKLRASSNAGIHFRTGSPPTARITKAAMANTEISNSAIWLQWIFFTQRTPLCANGLFLFYHAVRQLSSKKAQRLISGFSVRQRI